MRIERRMSTAAVMAVFTAGCATTMATPGLIVNDFEFAAPWLEVWDATTQAVVDRGWPLEVVETGSGLISTGWVPSDTLDLDCGSPGITHVGRAPQIRLTLRVADTQPVRLTVNVTGKQIWQGDGFFLTLNPSPRPVLAPVAVLLNREYFEIPLTSANTAQQAISKADHARYGGKYS